MHNYYVYVLTTDNNKVMYIGVTNDLVRRVDEHKNRKVDGFTKQYNVRKLVYLEQANKAEDAISREKQLKGWTRKKKNALVETKNPQWKDLSLEWQEDPSLRSG